MAPIRRVTLFKVPNEDDQNAILEQYKKLKQEALKEGKPYIVSLDAGKTKDDPRRKGYTICAISVFESIEDMQYYDTECSAHKSLKSVAIGKFEDIMTIYMESITEA
ncbi:hypothetical protein ABW19_dt0205655 [Dactylella cylindrospora]|nr:hypothetical protein ABW19_dt0205655 [Dactylella cylindrospora]